MKLSRNNTCTKCGREFTWNTIVAEELGSKNFKVSSYREDELFARTILSQHEKNEEGYRLPKEVLVDCPFCETPNKLNVDYD